MRWWQPNKSPPSRGQVSPADESHRETRDPGSTYRHYMGLRRCFGFSCEIRVRYYVFSLEPRWIDRKHTANSWANQHHWQVVEMNIISQDLAAFIFLFVEFEQNNWWTYHWLDWHSVFVFRAKRQNFHCWNVTDTYASMHWNSFIV